MKGYSTEKRKRGCAGTELPAAQRFLFHHFSDPFRLLFASSDFKRDPATALHISEKTVCGNGKK